MDLGIMITHKRLKFLYHQLKDKLWVKPLWICICSIFVVILAKLVDFLPIHEFIYKIKLESLEDLLEIMASSMLVIATFSIGNMVAAYNSASNATTPRSFSVVASDDVSKNALSRFIGSFIYSIVALIAVKNDSFGSSSLFILFICTCIVFAGVVLTFIYWVDCLARLGRVGNTIDRVEAVSKKSLLESNYFEYATYDLEDAFEMQITNEMVGYLQYVDLEALENWGEENDIRVQVVKMPGDFLTVGNVLARFDISENKAQELEVDIEELKEHFYLGADRVFESDPRFGFVVLSEIASKALSPAVNDPGTAIKVITSLVRLLTIWQKQCDKEVEVENKYVTIPPLATQDLFDDGFMPIARDGAQCLEVMIHLQDGLEALYQCGNEEMKLAAISHARDSLTRCEQNISFVPDLDKIKAKSLLLSTDQEK